MYRRRRRRCAWWACVDDSSALSVLPLPPSMASALMGKAHTHAPKPPPHITSLVFPLLRVFSSILYIYPMSPAPTDPPLSLPLPTPHTRTHTHPAHARGLLPLHSPPAPPSCPESPKACFDKGQFFRTSHTHTQTHTLGCTPHMSRRDGALEARGVLVPRPRSPHHNGYKAAVGRPTRRPTCRHKHTQAHTHTHTHIHTPYEGQ